MACLLTIAVGKEKIVGINMPTRYNSSKTINAARHVARALDISYAEVPIEDLVSINEEILEELDLDGSTKLTSLNKENIQAKIRGTCMLSNIAAKYHALFTSNANKLEVALGYATLYGDVVGAVAPIGDLTKEEIFQMAQYLNKEVFRREVIPEKLIPDELFRFRDDQIQPSAELKDNQVDPMKFGYHCRLIEALTDYRKKSPQDVLKWYLQGSMEKNLEVSTQLLERWNMDNPREFVKDLEWFSRGIATSVFKRVQSPPIIITSKSSYGYDIRESMLPYSQTLEYKRLKDQVLKIEKYETKVV